MSWRHENHGDSPLRREVESLFSDVLGFGRPPAADAGRWPPFLDLIEEPGVFIVEMDMPGVRLQDLSISVTGRRLNVRGTRASVRDSSSAHIRVRERWSGAFSRSIELPGPVDDAPAATTLHEGILRVVLLRRSAQP